MFTIWKRYRFSASHVLEGMPEGHQCGRLHGHNYLVEIELMSPTLDEHGFVMDFGDLAPVKKWIDEHWDHRHLNDCAGFSETAMTARRNPTAENMAQVLWYLFVNSYPQISAVRVQETETSWAEFRVRSA